MTFSFVHFKGRRALQSVGFVSRPDLRTNKSIWTKLNLGQWKEQKNIGTSRTTMQTSVNILSKRFLFQDRLQEWKSAEKRWTYTRLFVNSVVDKWSNYREITMPFIFHFEHYTGRRSILHEHDPDRLKPKNETVGYSDLIIFKLQLLFLPSMNNNNCSKLKQFQKKEESPFLKLELKISSCCKPVC